jgi:hydroxyacylglutathione hydrolase
MSQLDDVLIEAFVAEKLGNSSYLIGSRQTGAAIVIDPVRDIEPYLARAEALGLRVTMALETHIHNDFVSGAREVVAAVGATLGASFQAELAYPYQALHDSDELELGTWHLQVLTTPGHTPEHLSYLLTDAQQMPAALFSGGSLMVGTIARPDLLGPQHTPVLARAAYQTLHERLLLLPDEVDVYPTHGGGSFCAAGAGDRRTTTIGQERHHNSLIQATTYQQFLTRYLQLVPYPSYYKHMRALNRLGAPLLGRALPALRPLSAAEVLAAMQQGAVVVDVRPFAAYDEAHIPRSLNAGIDGPLSAWVGWVLEAETPLVLLGASVDDEREAQRELLRIGYDRMLGTLEGGMAAWHEAGYRTRRTEQMTTGTLARALEQGDEVTIVDSREEPEWAQGHIPGAVLMPVGQMPRQAGSLPQDALVAVHCAHGYRSAVAASLLERAGIPQILHVTDGYEEWLRHWKS